jgi:hypothetical protein
MQYLPTFTPFLWHGFVGKYSSTMEHLGIVLLLLFYHYPLVSLVNIQKTIEHGHTDNDS